jgi:hypothetical protein
MKVIDSADKNSIVSIARWHFYPNGYDFDNQIHWKTHNLVPRQSVPCGFNIPLHIFIIISSQLEMQPELRGFQQSYHVGY